MLVHGGLENWINVHDWGFSYGRFGRFTGTGGRYEIDQVKEGTLLIDVFDSTTRELVWRGVASAEVSAMPDADTINSTIQSVVARYPN